MLPLILKFVISAMLIVAISEVAKRSTALGALLASLPVTSILALGWLYHDTGDLAEIAALTRSIFWLVLPSLVLFLVLPVLLERGVPFWSALGLACAATALAYGGMSWSLPRLGVSL
ncbi:MAG: DUF3147 family protein [Gammaproteobacteria bacterium]|nr:DUF3147 family protein [Gammaproteobacteria bacterium]